MKSLAPGIKSAATSIPTRVTEHGGGITNGHDPRPHTHRAHPLLQLQRIIGNQATEQLLSDDTIQTKLRIGPANDRFEQEADRVADQVMRMPSPRIASISRISTRPNIQRFCPECEEELRRQPRQEEEEQEEELLQRQPEEEEELVQQKSCSAAPSNVTTAFESGINSLQGGGRPLSHSQRAFFEPRFGHNFSQVRVHTDANAARSAEEVSALAFTVGRNIVFGRGQYAPETNAGKRLLAHELTHVVQQSRVMDAKRKGEIQRQTSGARDLETTITVRWTDRDVDFYHRVINTIANSRRFRGVRTAALWQPFHSQIFRIHRQLARRSPPLRNGARVRLRVSAQFDPTVFHGQVTNASVLTEREARLREATITSQTVATSTGVRARTTIGVGEEVNLTHSAGSVNWTTTAGTLSATTGATVTLTAPDTAQRVTVSGERKRITFTVIAPNGVHRDRTPGSGIKHTINRPNSGIETHSFLLPDSVNFGNTEYREVDSPATASGTYSCHAGVGHDASPSIIPVASTVTPSKGSGPNGRDRAYSGHCGGTPPFTPGSISFSIPYEYRVGTGSFHRFATVDQVHTLAADASKLTTEKAGARGETTVTAATSTY